MKNIIVFIVLAVLGIVGYMWWQNSATVSAPVATQSNSVPAGEAMAGATKIAGERYLEYTTTAFDEAATKRRVLFFYANWCPICRPADAGFKQNADRIPEDVILFRVNFNDPDTDTVEEALAKKYGVPYQHTYILVNGEGKEIKRWNSGGFPELLENL